LTPFTLHVFPFFRYELFLKWLELIEKCLCGPDFIHEKHFFIVYNNLHSSIPAFFQMLFLKRCLIDNGLENFIYGSRDVFFKILLWKKSGCSLFPHLGTLFFRCFALFIAFCDEFDYFVPAHFIGGEWEIFPKSSAAPPRFVWKSLFCLSLFFSF